MTALGVFSFSCFLLSTAAEPCTAWISWCLQKALEMSRAALNLPAGEYRCSAVSPESHHVGEERLGPGYLKMTNPRELLCHAAVPKGPRARPDNSSMQRSTPMEDKAGGSLCCSVPPPSYEGNTEFY